MNLKQGWEISILFNCTHLEYESHFICMKMNLQNCMRFQNRKETHFELLNLVWHYKHSEIFERMNHCQITVKNVLNDDDDADDDDKLSFLYFDLIFLQNLLFHFTEHQGLTEHTLGKYWSISSKFG